MAKKRNRHVVVLAWVAVALSALLLVMVFGEGALYQGALRFPKPTAKVKVRRVAQVVTCKTDANLEGKFCAYTLEPINYFVMKDGDNFVIYGPAGENAVTKEPFDKINKILTDNSVALTDGQTFTAYSYSLVRSPNFAPITVGFKFKDRDGKQIPAFTIDKATADTLKDVRFVEVELPKSVKIRFNSFYLP